MALLMFMPNTQLIRTLTWYIYKYEINIGLIGH
jgi:hypothetical protein